MTDRAAALVLLARVGLKATFAECDSHGVHLAFARHPATAG
jgi:hypothetical protein